MSKPKSGMVPQSGNAAAGKGEYPPPHVADTGTSNSGKGGSGEYCQVSAKTGK